MGFDKLIDPVERGERVNSAIILVFMDIIYHLFLKMNKEGSHLCSCGITF
jgi:hypothetical protein